jgi:hypothetical protein
MLGDRSSVQKHGILFYGIVSKKRTIMENLKFNIDSVEVSYGDNALTSIIQIDERISSITTYLRTHNDFNDFEKTEIIDRLNKLIELNQKIQQELEAQVQKINDIKPMLAHEPMNEQLRMSSVL